MSWEAAGWMHWPDHPEPSAQFLRTLGVAQEGAAAISECFLAASRIDPADPESWHAAWMDRARRAHDGAARAQGSGQLQTAKSKWLRAATYYRASEALLAPDDGRRPAVFSQMLTCSQACLRLFSPSGEILEIDLQDGGVVDAYLVKPAGAGPWPCVICVGGLDGNKDELLPRMSRAALARGLALLLVDLPGQGVPLRLRGIPNRPDTEVPVSACVDFLAARRDIDADRIALYGASLGGVYAARAASAERRLKALVSDSLIFDLQAAFSRRLALQPTGDWAMLQWVFGCASPQAVVDKSGEFRMAEFMANIACPYLIVQGEHDFLGLQTALDAYAFARSAGIDVELEVFTSEDTGASHCQADNPTIGQELIADWLQRKLG